MWDIKRLPFKGHNTIIYLIFSITANALKILINDKTKQNLLSHLEMIFLLRSKISFCEVFLKSNLSRQLSIALVLIIYTD